MRKSLALVVLFVGVVFAGTFAYRTQAQQGRGAAPAGPPPAGPLYVITFVDLTPDNRVPGTEILKQYAADTRKAPGVTSVELLFQANRPNHFFMHIIFENQAAYDRHVEAQYTKDFRNKIGPMIGAPFDERPHYSVP